MLITFIRHGKTHSNLEKRYISKTDEPLSDVGILELKSNSYPKADYVITSPMNRCIETSKLIYPTVELIIANWLYECDFGDFEGKNYIELNNTPLYQKWINSNGEMTFPNGESQKNFCERSCYEFTDTIALLKDYKNISVVAHGGTIMSVMSTFALPKHSYFEYQIGNGCGYITEWKDNQITIISEIL